MAETVCTEYDIYKFEQQQIIAPVRIHERSRRKYTADDVARIKEIVARRPRVYRD